MESVKANEMEYSMIVCAFWDPLKMFFYVLISAELEEEANRLQKDSKTLSSDLIEYAQYMIREHKDNFKVRSATGSTLTERGDERETTPIFKFDSCYCIGIRQSKT